MTPEQIHFLADRIYSIHSDRRHIVSVGDIEEEIIKALDNQGELVAKRIDDLKAALLVYDVTLYCVVASGSKIMQGQINAALEAYRQATGEEPMLGEPVNAKGTK